MLFTTKWTGGAAAITLALTGAARADFTFSKVVDSSSTYASFGGPVLNNADQVAYRATLSAGGQGVFRTSFGPGGTSTTTIDTGTSFGGGVAINNAGTVAYVRQGSNPGVFASAGNGGPTATIESDGSIAGIYGALDGVAINDSGTVVYRSWISLYAGGGWGVAQGNGSGKPTGVSPNAAGTPYISTPAINNAGDIVYATRATLGATTITTTTRGDILSPATPYNEGFTSDAVTGIESFDTNGDGDLAFTAKWFNGRWAFVRNNGVLTRVLLNNFLTPGAIAINDNDQLAAIAADGTTTSIFTGTGSLSATVISTGDALDGSTVTGLGFDTDGVNDANQLAFLATLADGRQGIYVVSVPEPATAAGLGLIAGVTLLRRRRRPTQPYPAL